MLLKTVTHTVTERTVDFTGLVTCHWFLNLNHLGLFICDLDDKSCIHSSSANMDEFPPKLDTQLDSEEAGEKTAGS